MKFKQIRSATIKITYGNKTFLVDPFLAEKGTYPPFPNTANQDRRNPSVELPISIDEIIKDIDAVIITHTHLDHFDPKACEVLPKSIKVFAQDKKEEAEIKSFGFTNIEILSEKGTAFGDITLFKTDGIHAEEKSLTQRYIELDKNMSTEVCGVVFNHKDEKSLYIAGDTVWCDEVQEAINSYKPEIIILNSGDAQFADGKSLIMGKEDAYEVCKAAPNSTVIASHMEAVNHATLSRKELKEFVEEKQI
ncbi:MAG: MBL fold metallo-hydrolase, partial [Clostridium perfringens]|nr:MBL fold metallo-hydrolase [Clostridium perfringens]